MSDTLSDNSAEAPLSRSDYPTDSWQWKNTILRCEVGSGAHGTGNPAQEDHDEMAICVEPKNFVTGLDHFETMTWRPGRGPTDPSGPGDLDLTIYSARKWAQLAIKGNPSVLMMLFAPVLSGQVYSWSARAHPEWFLHTGVIHHYIGYMNAQKMKLMGERGGTHGAFRQSLIDEHGYDVKYAMHTLRLGFQGIEFITTGKIELPIPEPTRQLLVDVRHGKWTLKDVGDLANDLLEELRALEAKNLIAPYPNRIAISWWLHKEHEFAWQ